MATIKYRINKGAWQTATLSAPDCTGFTLVQSETYPVPAEYLGTYVKSGLTVNQYDESTPLVVWYCSSNGKTLYTKSPYSFSEAYMTDNFDPWSYEEENYFYVYDPTNMTYNLTQCQKLSLNLNAGDEVEVICASRAVFDNTKEPEETFTPAHVIRYGATMPHDIYGNINSVSYGEGFDGANATFKGFDDVYGNVEGYEGYSWEYIGVPGVSFSSYAGWFSQQGNLRSAENMLVMNIDEQGPGCKQMFAESSLETPPQFLPDMQLHEVETEFPWTNNHGCYEEMFYSSGIKTAPKLPATKLEYSCYQRMFRGCYNLEKAPELPANELPPQCYYQMFESSSITTPPKVIPATSISGYCCAYMFDGCSELTKAPLLPATSVEYGSYEYMFGYCTSLKTATELPATSLNPDCYRFMFIGCEKLEDGPSILPAMSLFNECYQHMFNGCCSLKSAPVLPATSLTPYCYQGMFKYCSGLTAAPVLPAKTVSSFGYYEMFYGCSSLNYVKAMFTSTPGETSSTSYRTKNWLSGVSATGTFVKNASATWNVSGPSGIPNGWTVETATE